MVTCKIKHLQKICKNVSVFYLHVTASKNVSEMFYATNICKSAVKRLQIFLQMFQHMSYNLEHMLKIGGDYM